MLTDDHDSKLLSTDYRHKNVSREVSCDCERTKKKVKGMDETFHINFNEIYSNAVSTTTTQSSDFTRFFFYISEIFFTISFSTASSESIVSSVYV